MAQEDPADKRSIVIVEMPREFIDREILKDHFEAFGKVERVACSLSKQYAIIHFSTADEAKNAMQNGTIIRPHAAALKISHRSVSVGLNKQQQIPTASTSTAPPSPTKVVTRRKIVRSFPSGSSQFHGGTPFGGGPSESAAEGSSMSSVGPSVPAAPSLSERSQPFRSSLKVSRPSPIVRRKPTTIVDKSGKSPVAVPRNPFALPPRGALTLDRRKKSFPPRTATDSGRPSAQRSSSSFNFKDARNIKVTANFQETDVKSEVELSATPQSSRVIAKVDVPEAKQSIDTESTPAASDKPKSSFPRADIDESTEDCPTVYEESEKDSRRFEEDNYNVLADAETDTQDTVEVTTEEEEGEILDDEDQQDEDIFEDEGEEERDDEDNDEKDEEIEDAYESPLKRLEAASKTATTMGAPSMSDSSFAFKLSPVKESADISGSSAASFKLPFSSPFSFGDTPKPFSSSSFGTQFKGSTTSSNIFSATPATSINTQTEKKSEVSAAADQSKSLFSEKNEKISFAPNKDDLKSSASASSETAKLKPSGIFSLFGNSTSTFPSSSKSLLFPGTSESHKAEEKSTQQSPIKFPALPITSGIDLPTSKPTIIGGDSVFSKSITMIKPAVVPPTISTTVSLPKDTPNPLLLTFNPDTPEAQELFVKKATTVEDRYRILEARDKLIRSRIPKTKVNVEFASKLIGTCPDMCSEKERYMRQFQRQLVSYETLPGPDFAVDHCKAVKVYSRSSADQEEPLPHELRPGPTLDFTMHYLLQFIVPLGDNPDENLSDWYNFLWDRTRSIRKDITQQQIIDMTAVSLYEKCARFHIHCASRLCELDVHSFDPKLNDENLMKCLQSLEHLYDDLRRRQVNCPSEPEFRAYQIMMNLNEGDALYNAQQLPNWILNSEVVQTALKLHHSIYTRNFIAFFRTVEKVPYMISCILHRYFFQVRSLALRCFIKAHCTLPKYETAMPMSTLQRMLGYGPHGALSFSYLCESHGIHCDIEENRVILKRKLFYLPEFPSIYREQFLIDSKLQTSVAEAINGGPLPNISIAAHKPQNSFNEAGQLIAGNVVGSYDSKSTVAAFVPPESNVALKPAPKSLFQLPVSSFSQSQGGFMFGTSFQQQPKKELQPPRPHKEIEAACQTATTKLVDDFIQQDLVEISRAQLEDARKIREKDEKKRRQVQVVTRISSEFVEKFISETVNEIVQKQSASSVKTFLAVEEVSRATIASLIEENVQNHVRITASTEFKVALEIRQRQMVVLRGIFRRLRARFVVEKWKRFARRKKMEREKEEEKRRAELWNFPVINSYSRTPQEVFKAFCGRSSAQPSINKVEMLRSPEVLLINPSGSLSIKRKSDGESVENQLTPPYKYPRLVSESESQRRIDELWNFPAVNPYSRTNRQVLEAFCGSSSVINLPISPKVNTFDAANNLNKSPNFLPDNSFRIHKPKSLFYRNGRVSDQIKSKANESTTDFLTSVQGFLQQVKDENVKSETAEKNYSEKIELLKKNCPELDNLLLTLAHGRTDDDIDSIVPNFDDDSERMSIDDPDYLSTVSSNIFGEQDLLTRIRSFVRQVREEKAKSWNSNTFLNEIDVNLYR